VEAAASGVAALVESGVVVVDDIAASGASASCEIERRKSSGVMSGSPIGERSEACRVKMRSRLRLGRTSRANVTESHTHSETGVRALTVAERVVLSMRPWEERGVRVRVKASGASM
jgi:hypothetical protein